jgi:chromosome segregation ATPase
MSDPTNAERQARWRVRRAKEIEALRKAAAKGAGPSSQELARAQAEIAQLRRELAAATRQAPAAEPPSLAALKQELTAAKARIAELERTAAAKIAALNAELRDATPKQRTSKPPLPPDEQRERRIKALNTQVRNLKANLATIAGRGSMSFATQSAIAKCLHPDHKPSEAQRADACRLFTQWKAEKDLVARKAKG